jgi:hypothetical protein
VVHAVLAWTESESVLVPCRAPTSKAAALARLPVTNAVPMQLCFELDDVPMPSSSGLTWATWSLPSIPTELRGLALADVASVVAAELEAVPA